MNPQRSSSQPHLAGDARQGHDGWLRGPLLALQFLTVLPVRVPAPAAAVDGAAGNDDSGMEAALPWFPTVGAALGCLTALVDWALAPVFSLGVRDVILVALPLLLTGMLHADGFVDCCDALLGYHSVERRLEILRDSRVGAYGALGGALLLLARYAALGALTPPVRAMALIVAPLLGRWGIVYAVTRYRYARSRGLGAHFQARTAHLLAASALALALLGVVWRGFAVGTDRYGTTALLLTLLAVAAVVVTFCWSAWASRRLGGGLTGDTYGALNELAEVAVLTLAPPLSALVWHLCGGLCR